MPAKNFAIRHLFTLYCIVRFFSHSLAIGNGTTEAETLETNVASDGKNTEEATKKPQNDLHNEVDSADDTDNDGLDDEYNATAIKAKIDEFVQGLMQCRGVPGLTIALVKDGKPFLARGYGVKNMNSGEQVGSKTLFQIGRLTKAFSATLLWKILQEYSNGTTVDTPLRKIYDTSPYTFDKAIVFSQEELTWYTTLRDLLSHRTGIPSNRYLHFQEHFSGTKMLSILEHLKTTWGFRAKFQYNDLLYHFIGYMTEKLYQFSASELKSWEDLVNEHLFQPIGMDSSTFVLNAVNNSNDMATPYLLDLYSSQLREVEKDFQRAAHQAGAADSIVSNAEDMQKWLMMQVHEGTDGTPSGNVVISPKYIKQTHLPQMVSAHPSRNYLQIPNTPVTFEYSQYGQGWYLGHYRGHPMLTSNDIRWGWSSAIVVLKAKKIGLFVSMNREDREFYIQRPLQFYILDLLLGKKPWLNTSTACQFPEPYLKPKAPPKVWYPSSDINLVRPSQVYEGTYMNPAYGIIRIYLDEENGALMMSYGNLIWELFPKPSTPTVDVFYGKGMGSNWHFNLARILLKVQVFEDYTSSVEMTLPNFNANPIPKFNMVHQTDYDPTDGGPATPKEDNNNGCMGSSTKKGFAMYVAFSIFSMAWK